MNIDGITKTRNYLKCKYVYFIRITNSPIVKIGMAVSPDERLKSIQWGCPCNVELVGWIKCNDAFKLEQFFHKKFASRRTSGEWFILDKPEINCLISEISKRKNAWFTDNEWDYFVSTNPNIFTKKPSEATRAFVMSVLCPDYLKIEETSNDKATLNTI